MTPMRITLVRAVNRPLDLRRDGDSLSFNGEILDLSALSEGDSLPWAAMDCPWLVADVERSGGVLRLTVIAPYAGGDLPEALWHPAAIVDPADGPVPLPEWTVAGFDEP